jgi:hypothetical protein
MAEGAVSGEYVFGVCVLYDDLDCAWYVSYFEGVADAGVVPGDGLYEKTVKGEEEGWNRGNRENRGGEGPVDQDKMDEIVAAA